MAHNDYMRTSSANTTAAPQDKSATSWIKTIPSQIDRGMERWEALAQGLRYSVYDCGDVVIKIPLNSEDIASKLEQRGAKTIDIGKVKSQHVSLIRLLEETRQLMFDGKIPPKILANASIEANGEIKQSKIEPLASVFNSASTVEKLELLAEVGNCLESQLRHGFLDSSLEPLASYGLNKEQQVVLLDFGGITFSKPTALQIAENADWAQKISLTKLDPFFHQAYCDLLSTVLTRSNILTNWGRGP